MEGHSVGCDTPGDQGCGKEDQGLTQVTRGGCATGSGESARKGGEASKEGEAIHLPEEEPPDTIQFQRTGLGLHRQGKGRMVEANSHRDGADKGSEGARRRYGAADDVAKTYENSGQIRTGMEGGRRV